MQKDRYPEEVRSDSDRERHISSLTEEEIYFFVSKLSTWLDNADREKKYITNISPTRDPYCLSTVFASDDGYKKNF